MNEHSTIYLKFQGTQANGMTQCHGIATRRRPIDEPPTGGCTQQRWIPPP